MRAIGAKKSPAGPVEQGSNPWEGLPGTINRARTIFRPALARPQRVSTSKSASIAAVGVSEEGTMISTKEHTTMAAIGAAVGAALGIALGGAVLGFAGAVPGMILGAIGGAMFGSFM